MADSTTTTTSNPKSSPNEEIADPSHIEDSEIITTSSPILPEQPPEVKERQIQEELDQWKKTTVKIAVIGQSGVGKSSFINKFRGLTPKDKHKKDSQGNYLYAAVSFNKSFFFFCLQKIVFSSIIAIYK